MKAWLCVAAGCALVNAQQISEQISESVLARLASLEQHQPTRSTGRALAGALPPLFGTPSSSKACNATSFPNIKINNTVYDGVYAFNRVYFDAAAASASSSSSSSSSSDQSTDQSASSSPSYAAFWDRVLPQEPLASAVSYHLIYNGNVSTNGSSICTGDQFWTVQSYANKTRRYPLYIAADCAAHPSLIKAKWFVITAATTKTAVLAVPQVNASCAAALVNQTKTFPPLVVTGAPTPATPVSVGPVVKQPETPVPVAPVVKTLAPTSATASVVASTTCHPIAGATDAGYNLQITGTTGREYDGYFVLLSDTDLAGGNANQGWQRTTLTAAGATVLFFQSANGIWVLDSGTGDALTYPVYSNPLGIGNNDPTRLEFAWLKKTCARCDSLGYPQQITIRACAL